ncbi:UxaA family hydrolase [Escherichia coli]|nr:UxaA family hydrolase [Escherichia coli]
MNHARRKSLGAYTKSGDSPIQEYCCRQSAPLSGSVSDGCGSRWRSPFRLSNINDSSEAMELIATGCHMIYLPPDGVSVIGSVIAPVIKVCNNPQTRANMADDMDVNAGRVLAKGHLDDGDGDSRLYCGNQQWRTL